MLLEYIFKLQMWKYVKILVQNWMCKNEVKDVKVTKITENHHIKKTLFQIHPNKFYSKNDNILLEIEFRRNSEIFVSKFIERD